MKKLFALILFLIAFVVFNLWHSTAIQTPREREFEEWINRVDSGGEVNTGYPKLTLTLKDGDSGSMRLYKLGDTTDIEKRMRILGLLKESKLHISDDDQRAIESHKPSGSVKIEGQNKAFYFPFFASEVDHNVSAQTMLKLFVLYADIKTEPKNS
jgi:hypothetical protein